MQGQDDIRIVMTESGTLFTAVPDEKSGFLIRRYRGYGHPKKRNRAFGGTLVSLDDCSGGRIRAIGEGGEVLQLEAIDATAGYPRRGLRMLAGRLEAHHEITSRVVSVHTMPREREWVLDWLFRAYRNGCPRWLALRIEQPFEQGLEGIKDDESGQTQRIRESFYRRFLGALAAPRGRNAIANQPPELQASFVKPRMRLVSNDELAGALLESTCGAGSILIDTSFGDALPVRRKQRAAVATTIDAYLDFLESRLEHPAPELATAA